MNENILKMLKDNWLKQIHLEYSSICYGYSLKLKRPNIAIENSKNVWGYWDSHRKLIMISEQLIRNYSWEIVLSVLKHEMAHQIVSEIFGVDDGHGVYFKKACGLLGLEEEFCRSTLSMEKPFVHWKNKNNNLDEDNHLILKIEKLLNLAQSSNENEAALAMEKVQQLYEKYNIVKLKLGQKQNYYTLVLNFKKKRIPLTHCLAAYILMQHFFVQVLFSELYDPMQDTRHKTIEVLGTQQNITMAEYVFYFLIHRVEQLWLNYSKEKKLTIKYKLSYQRGLLDGFLKKLDQSKLKRRTELQQEDVNALICLKDVELNSYVQSQHPRVTKSTRTAKGVYSEHFQKGLEEGKKMNINKPIQNSATSHGKMLTN